MCIPAVGVIWYVRRRACVHVTTVSRPVRAVSSVARQRRWCRRQKAGGACMYRREGAAGGEGNGKRPAWWQAMVPEGVGE